MDDIITRYGESKLTLIPIIHDKKCGGCGHASFFYDHRPHKGEMSNSHHTYNLDGSRPKQGDLPICGSCDKQHDFNQVIPEGGWAPRPMLAGFWYAPYIPLLVCGEPSQPCFDSTPTSPKIPEYKVYKYQEAAYELVSKEDGSDSHVPYGEH